MGVGHLGGRTRTEWAVHNLPLPTLHADLGGGGRLTCAPPAVPASIFVLVSSVNRSVVGVAILGWDCRTGPFGERGDDGGKD
jgi:hypothetical protein